jgi:phage terminase large subunit
VEDHCKEIRKWTRGLPIEAWICDHDAEDRATLERHLHCQTRPAFKDVAPGIEAVKTRLASNRLKFLSNALVDVDPELEKRHLPTCTVDEITGYRWSDKKQDVPVKELDHGLDELRYVVAYIDKISATRANIANATAKVTNYLTDK